MTKERITTRFSPATPCPVCQTGTKGCSVDESRLYYCRGEPVKPDEWREITRSPDAAGFRHYRNNITDPRAARRRGRKPGAAGTRREPGEPTGQDWEARAARYAGLLRPIDRTFLANRLGVPVATLDLVPLLGTSGEGSDGPTVTFPEHDGAGRVIGLSERIPSPDGHDAKKQIRGGKRGLTLTTGWNDLAGAVFVVEGPSDTLAMAAAGLACVGRPGNAAGAELLAELFRDLPADRPIVVVGENDRKLSGDWPGRDGCLAVAHRLATDLKRPVRAALPPPEAKDCRAWLTDPARSGTWAERGAKLAAHLTSAESAPLPPPETNGRHRDRPGAAGGSGNKANIVIGTDEHRVNDDAVAALARHAHTYRRGGRLVYVSWEPAATEEIGSSVIHYPAGAQIVLMSLATLRERLTEVAVWKTSHESTDGSGASKPAHPPKWCPPAVLDRKEFPGIRPLHALADFPCFVNGGKILSRPGYDPDTAIYFAPTVPVQVDVPADPGRADVAMALETLSEVLVDFPFLKACHRSAWLAGLLTPLARFAFRGPAPLFLVEANVPGAGKGLLVEVAHLIVRGEEAAGLDFPRKSEELDKVVTSLLVRGETTASFDNVEGQLGGAVLNRLLTASMWEGRILSTSTTVRVPNLCTWWATGNNVAIVGDTARRVCPIRLESRLENPEDRADLRHENLKAWVRQNRPRLLSAALTILLAYHRAGRPDQKLKNWGSFESWSALVRGAIVWAGWPDPHQSREGLRQAGDSRIQAMRVLLTQWGDLHATKNELTCREVIEAVEDEKAAIRMPDLVEAIAILAPPSKPDRASSLGYAFRSFYHRVIDGKMLTSSVSHTSIKRWEVTDSSDSLFDSGGDGVDGGDSFYPSRTRAQAHTRTHAGEPPPEQSPPSTPSPPAKGTDLTDELLGGR